jgi:hypothetical protein
MVFYIGIFNPPTTPNFILMNELNSIVNRIYAFTLNHYALVVT